jgi:hypothetical protein
MVTTIAPALRALIKRLIDYAGMFPPATLPRDSAIANYRAYQRGEHAWMLRWLVVAAAELEEIPKDLDGALSVLSDVDQPRAAAIETKKSGIMPLASGEARRPVYCEVSIGDLDVVQRSGSFAKLRTGGIKPEAIPSVEEVAAFIVACAQRRLPFKATAGLHHPLRASQPLTYDAHPPRAVMHGFLNVFLAAAFAWHGERNLEPILAETDAGAFRFDQRARWRDLSLDAGQVREARQQFAHAFGSCSFTEPVEGLQTLGLI